MTLRTREVSGPIVLTKITRAAFHWFAMDHMTNPKIITMTALIGHAPVMCSGWGLWVQLHLNVLE